MSKLKEKLAEKRRITKIRLGYLKFRTGNSWLRPCGAPQDGSTLYGST